MTVNPTCVEVSVKVANDDKSYVHKHLCYEPITLCMSDHQLSSIVQAALSEFKGNVDDVVIKARMVWQ